MFLTAFSKATFVLIFFLFLGVRSQDPSCTGDEFIAHPNCSLYYHCSNGVPVEDACPDGLVWNDDLKGCDFPSNVPECEGGTRVPIPTTTQIVTSTTAPTTTQPPEVLRCGGLVTNTSSISYKPDSTLEPNERCVWTILSPPGTFTFTRLTNGSDTPSLVITLFRRLNATLTMGSVAPNKLNETFVGDADVVVITAFSGDNPTTSKGFTLSYVSVPFGDGVSEGTQEIHSALPTSTTHPPEGTETYGDNDLSTFLFAPNNYGGSTQTTYNVSYTPRFDSTAVCPGDTVYAFEFDLTGAGSGALLHWTTFKAQCVSAGFWTRQTNEAVLIVFRSDFTSRGEGFHISYEV